MKMDSSTECWNQVEINSWVDIAEKNDFRNYFIMPYTLQKLKDVSGKQILDLGCGEGGYSRVLANEGAIVTAVDCSEIFLKYIDERAISEGLSIETLLRNANDLKEIADAKYDIVLCSMMLMDVEDVNGTLKEIYRVIKSGGKVFISMLHPCYKPKESRWISEDGKIKVVIEDYFRPTEWMGEIKGIDAPVTYRHRTLSDYVKAFIKNGFSLVDMDEPLPTEEQTNMSPRIKWLSKIPMYLFIEIKK